MKNRSILHKVAARADRLNIVLFWVRGHQEEPLSLEARMNVHADVHAKERAKRVSPPCFRECWEYADKYAVLWKGALYEGDIRKKVYNCVIRECIHTVSCTYRGAPFSRAKCWVEDMDQIDMMNYTSIVFKMLTNTLPVHDMLYKRWPGLYENVK